MIFNGKRKTPDIILYLGKVLPYAIMGMLVVYCLKDMSFKAAADFVTLTNEEDGAAAAILRAVPELNLSPKAQNETNL